MNRIGTKIYYCLITGNVLQIVGDMFGYVIETTFEQDYEVYSSLKERDINSIGIIKFEFGEYPKLSEGTTGVIVDLETKELIFSYDELPPIPQPPSKIEELENKISILEEENANLKASLQTTQEAVDFMLMGGI